MKLKQALAATVLSITGLACSASVVFVGSFSPEGPNNPSGSGTARIVFDPADNTLAFDVIFSGLSSPTTVAHVHCCTALPGVGNAGVVVEPPSLQNFPVGVLSGHYVEVIDLDDPGNVNPSFVSNVNIGNGNLQQAINFLVAGMSDHRAYFNIHTQANPGGEIRARLQVPEPAAAALVLAAGLAAALARRRQRPPLTSSTAPVV